MASFKRQKVALRATVYAFIAGIHSVTQELVLETEENDLVELETDYHHILHHPQSCQMLVEIMDEEELYPFGNEWPQDQIKALVDKLFAPKLTSKENSLPRFRFRKGFKNLLQEAALSIESEHKNYNHMDHWLVLLINTVFFAGATLAARQAKDSKKYYLALQRLEMETDPWERYSQITELMHKQLRRETRRKTGLTSDLEF